MARLDELKARWAKDLSPRSFLPLAEEYRRLGRLAEAERVCREGLQRHPNYHSARVLLGRALLDLDRLEEAAEEFCKVLQAEPQNLLAGRLLAGIYRSQGRWAEALETFRHLQAYYPDDAEVRAQVYQLERGPEAPPAASSGAPSDRGPTQSDGALATNTLAEIYLRQGLVDRALAVYENMLRADADNQAVRRRIAEIQGADPVGSRETRSPGASPARAPENAPVLDGRRRVIRGLEAWLIGIQKG